MATNQVNLIRQCTARLARPIASTCGTPRIFFDLLVQNGLLSDNYLGALDKVDTLGVSDYDKVSTLLSMVVTQIQFLKGSESDEMFHTLLSTVEEIDPRLSDVVGQVLKEYEPGKETSTLRPRTRSRNNTQMETAYRALRIAYGSFLIALSKKLKKKNLDELKTVWSHICKEGLNNAAMNSNTVEEFIRIASHDGELPALCYQALSDLTISLLKTGGERLISEYERKIKQCLKSQVCQGVKQVKVKVDKHLTNETSIQDITNTLAKVFKFTSKEIVLLSVKKGCIELTYLVSTLIGAVLKEWKSVYEDSETLDRANIELISLEGFEVWRRKSQKENSGVKGKTIPAETAIDIPEHQTPAHNKKVKHPRPLPSQRIILRGPLGAATQRQSPARCGTRQKRLVFMSLILLTLIILSWIYVVVNHHLEEVLKLAVTVTPLVVVCVICYRKRHVIARFFCRYMYRS